MGWASVLSYCFLPRSLHRSPSGPPWSVQSPKVTHSPPTPHPRLRASELVVPTAKRPVLCPGRRSGGLARLPCASVRSQLKSISPNPAALRTGADTAPCPPSLWGYLTVYCDSFSLSHWRVSALRAGTSAPGSPPAASGRTGQTPAASVCSSVHNDRLLLCLFGLQLHQAKKK